MMCSKDCKRTKDSANELETYQKQLSFQIQQQQNAQIGMMEAAPGNIPASVTA